MAGVFERTVRKDLTVRFEGQDWEPKNKYDHELAYRWIGHRVQVTEHNYWGTELTVSPHLHMDVQHHARFVMPGKGYESKVVEKERIARSTHGKESDHVES